MVRDDLVLLAAGALGVLGVFWWVNRQGVGKVASGVAGGLVEAAGGVVTGTVVAVGEVVGVPATNADRAHALMDAYPAASWSDQAYMAFQISAYASLVDYLKWTVDKSHRPEPGAY